MILYVPPPKKQGIKVVNKWFISLVGSQDKRKWENKFSLSLYFFRRHHHHYQASHSASCTIVIIIVGVMRVHQENILSNGIHIQLDYNLTQTTDIVYF